MPRFLDGLINGTAFNARLKCLWAILDNTVLIFGSSELFEICFKMEINPSPLDHHVA